jgi:hypothetical protein
MLIYSQNKKRMAVVITLPFITCVQNMLFSRMMEQAHEITGNVESTGKSTNKPGKKSHKKRITKES